MPESCSRCGMPVRIPAIPADMLAALLARPVVCVGCSPLARKARMVWPCAGCGRDVHCRCKPACQDWPCARRGRFCLDCLARRGRRRRDERIARLRAQRGGEAR